MINFGNINNVPTLHTHLYKDPSVKNLDLPEIATYLKGKLGSIQVDVREAFIKVPDELLESFAERLAKIKIRDLNKPHVSLEPLPGEVEYEKRILKDPARKLFGIFYDGFKLQTVLWDLIPKEEKGLEHAHVVFTNRLFGTWDEVDRRYHARVSIYGFPSLISTTGIVEAPAKPKEFYLLKRQYLALGITDVPLEELKRKFKGKFIDYDDERLTEVMKGYVMQAVFYHLTLDPFCSNKRCRLYNSHWQEEVIEAQLKPPEFCEKHERALEQLKLKFQARLAR
jgi:predicted Zn-dependent protease